MGITLLLILTGKSWENSEQSGAMIALKFYKNHFCCFVKDRLEKSKNGGKVVPFVADCIVDSHYSWC